MTRILNANPNKVTKPLAFAGGFVLYFHSRGVENLY
nr:MAG TPA: Flagellar M-ring protein, Flagellar motor motor, switch complex, MOTOR [Caudoviricetes sp.]